VPLMTDKCAAVAPPTVPEVARDVRRSATAPASNGSVSDSPR
jgi:hypothetical protein